MPIFLLSILSMVCVWGQTPNQIVNFSCLQGTTPGACPAGNTNGLMVWGDYGFAKYYQAFLGQPGPANIGVVKPGNRISNKVAAFAKDRAPGIWMGSWTNGSAPPAVDITYPEVVLLRVKVWVLCVDEPCVSTPLTQADRGVINSKLAAVNLLFLDQSAGILLDLRKTARVIEDKTGETAKRARYKNFNNVAGAAADCSVYPDLMKDMSDTGALNLYFVSTVTTQTGRGETCMGIPIPNAAVFAHLADAGLIAHEIGHNHYLVHSDCSVDCGHTQFGKNNVMHSLSSQRKYFSEGEVFVMHFEERSVLNYKNSILSVPKAPRVEAKKCEASVVPLESRFCPPIGERLWEDKP